MSLETGSYIKDLVSTNPEGTDPKSQGDDHLRLLKNVLKTQFSGFTLGVPITITEAELNSMLVAGDYGLGGSALPFFDANAAGGIQRTAFFHFAGAPSANVPPGATAGDTMIQVVANPTLMSQQWTSVGTGQLWIRYWQSSVWSAWIPYAKGPKQTTMVDTTAEAVLKVGAFGLGVSGSVFGLSDLDNPLRVTHFISIQAGMGGVIPPSGNVGDMVLNVCFSATSIYQLFWVNTTGLVFSRRFNGTWSAWICVTAMGVAQTWQNVLATRALGVAYTNTTPRAIEVAVVATGVTGTSGAYIEGSVAGVVTGRMPVTETNGFSGNNYIAATATLTFVVPAGASYAVSPSGAAALNFWSELR